MRWGVLSNMLKYPEAFRHTEESRGDYCNIKSIFIRDIKKCEVTTSFTIADDDHVDWDLPG